MSGTFFDCRPPRVNDMFAVRGSAADPFRLRVAWTASAIENVHMVGFQRVSGPVAT